MRLLEWKEHDDVRTREMRRPLEKLTKTTQDQSSARSSAQTNFAWRSPPFDAICQPVRNVETPMQQSLASAGPLGGVTEKDLKRATNAGRMGYFGKDSDHVPIFLRVRISSARGTMLGVMSRSPPAAAGRGQVSFERTQQWQFSFGRMSWMGCLETRAQYRNRINCKKRYAQQRRLRSLPRSESPQGGTRQRNAAQTMYNRVITPHITATL